VTPTANPNVSNQQTTTTTTATASPLGPTESPAVPELQALPLVVILFTFMLALPLFKKKLQGTMK